MNSPNDAPSISSKQTLTMGEGVRERDYLRLLLDSKRFNRSFESQIEDRLAFVERYIMEQ